MRAIQCELASSTTKETKITEVANIFPTTLEPTSVLSDTIQFVEKVFNISATMEETIKVINNEFSSRLGVGSRTYYVNADDALLCDPINHSAAPLNDTTAVGRSASIMSPYELDSTIYLPLVVDGALVGCIESPEGCLKSIDISSMASMLRIAAAALRNAIQASRLQWETQKAEAMVAMATRLARDTLDETVLVQSIMSTAKELTESDRCSVFLVKEDGTLEAHFEDGSIVGMPADAGIAGYVARTGSTVNIPDAYKDNRFNRQVDKSTGYHTKTILCLPIMHEGSIVAVAQLINKLDFVTDSGLHLQRTFVQRDEELFETFSMFAAASLRNCRTNENLLKETKKIEVILDVVTLLSNTDIRDVDSIVQHVLHGAKQLLSADRSSLFLLDKERNELYSRMADSVSGGEIRFQWGRVSRVR
ncbi:unnamed protein product [Phytomonas sp. Hart1]|nr:unnamed protein product [Phytomonas sp. Hart1]|eukprot:CCW67820.1 unnamed protein product [Phytomonas sp. isolate Hart1]